MTCKDCIHNEVCYRREVCNDIEEHIRKLGCMDFIARADVTEVRHGEWVQIGYDEALDRITCSCCKEYFNLIDNCTEAFNYCPNCGAKMDGKEVERE